MTPRKESDDDKALILKFASKHPFISAIIVLSYLFNRPIGDKIHEITHPTENVVPTVVLGNTEQIKTDVEDLKRRFTRVEEWPKEDAQEHEEFRSELSEIKAKERLQNHKVSAAHKSDTGITSTGGH